MASFINRNRKIALSTTVLLLSHLFGQAQSSFSEKLSAAAILLTADQVRYDPSYFSISYPNGDVPADRGVCTDVIIRAYRKLNIDLQKAVHEDMAENFSAYPNHWGLKKTDKNIDHRRVPNLMTYFARHGIVKKKSQNPEDFQPGDIVAWDLGGGITHIGILISKQASDGKTPLVVHNIGNGQEISDCLFKYEIIGHYTYPK